MKQLKTVWAVIVVLFAGAYKLLEWATAAFGSLCIGLAVGALYEVYMEPELVLYYGIKAVAAAMAGMLILLIMRLKKG